jgi:hypothetical protein
VTISNDHTHRTHRAAFDLEPLEQTALDRPGRVSRLSDDMVVREVDTAPCDPDL